MFLFKHPLVKTLRDLRGNVRGCVYTEALWGIPFNLYAPYVSVYMLALGLSDSEVGLITSVGLAFQVFWTLMSGVITDKLGRKRTTLIFDLISWSIPTLIWALAQNFTYFLVAAFVNAVWRVTSNSWQCLMVEDTDPEILVDVWSWIYIAGLLAAFVSPLTGLLIDQFSLVPTMRGLYLLAFVMMTAKFVIMNRMVTETQPGLVRMKATRDQPLFSGLKEYPQVMRGILRAPATLVTAALMIILSISRTINGTFWSILVTQELRIPEQHLAIYPFARSMAMLLFFFLLMPKIRQMEARLPMLVGYMGFVMSQLILINAPVKSYGWVLVATLLEACSLPLIATLLDKLIVLNVDPAERARIMAILYAVVIVFTSPFGWIAGKLSEIDRGLPFVINVVIFIAGGLIVLFAGRLEGREGPVAEPAEESAALRG
jgi:MFS family permease